MGEEEGSGLLQELGQSGDPLRTIRVDLSLVDRVMAGETCAFALDGLPCIIR